MRSVTQLVLDTVALELGTGRPGVAPDFTLEELVRRVWGRNWKTLQAEGFTKDDLRAIAGGVWACAEACGWPSVLQLVDASIEDLNHPARRSVSLSGWQAEIFAPRAGTLELPSGTWAWIAPERGDFIHVCFQHLQRPHDRMEAAIRMAEFSLAELGRIAREPSIRWWQDRTTGVTWELRANLRLMPQRSRDISFSHVQKGTRTALVADGTHLGEMTDEQLRTLLTQAEDQIPDTGDRRDCASA